MISFVPTRLVSALVVMLGTGSNSFLHAQVAKERDPCPNVMTALGRSPTSIAQRANIVEVRVCDPGVLQLVAWGQALRKPLIIETNRTSIVSAVTASDTVYVIETGGASSNVVQAIVFEKGIPRLAMNEAVRAYADISVSWKTVVVTIRVPNAPPKVLTLETGIE